MVSVPHAHRLVFKVILKDIEQVIGEAVGAVAIAVFLHLGDHAPQSFSANALLSRVAQSYPSASGLLCGSSPVPEDTSRGVQEQPKEQ